MFPFVLNRLFQQVGFAAAVRWTTLILGVLLILAIALTSSPMKPKGWRQGRRSLASLKVFTRLDFLLYVSGGFAFL